MSTVRLLRGKTATASLIFLHGLGDTSAGWSPFVEDAWAPLFSHVRFILPTAPVRPVTLNFGFSMPAWYDILGLSDSAAEDTEGVAASAAFVNKLIDAEIESGVPAERIVIGGFSQGGAIALYTALTSTRRLGGCLVLSAYLPLAKTFPASATDVGKSIPVFQAHGDADQVVKFSWGTKTRDAVKAMGVNVDFHTYRGMGHSADDREMTDIAVWLRGIVPELAESGAAAAVASAAASGGASASSSSAAAAPNAEL